MEKMFDTGDVAVGVKVNKTVKGDVPAQPVAGGAKGTAGEPTGRENEPPLVVEKGVPCMGRGKRSP